MKEGSKAPAFALKDQDDKTHRLSDYNGRWVLVYFYPKDDTPGCTKEACEIRDAWSDLQKLNLQVFGISGDTTSSHKKFVDKFELPFTLLSDTDRTTMEKYGALKEKSMFGKKFLGIERMSVLINPKGIVVKVYKNVKPETHATQVLNDLKVLI